MSFEWIDENPPLWDEGKAAIVGGVPAGVFAFGTFRRGDVIPGEWWRVEENGTVLGYGWMDCNWGDAEILLAVDPSSRGRGVGTFILDRLEQEAAARGVNYMLNEVRPSHPEREAIRDWLGRRGFAPSADGRLLRRVVHVRNSS